MLCFILTGLLTALFWALVVLNALDFIEEEGLSEIYTTKLQLKIMIILKGISHFPTFLMFSTFLVFRYSSITLFDSLPISSNRFLTSTLVTIMFLTTVKPHLLLKRVIKLTPRASVKFQPHWNMRSPATHLQSNKPSVYWIRERIITHRIPIHVGWESLQQNSLIRTSENEKKNIQEGLYVPMWM